MTIGLSRHPHSYREDAAVPSFADDRPIIIFDGHCGFCSVFARFILRHDRRGTFRLLPAQTPLGRALYVHYGLDPQDYETNILIADGTAWFKSESTIRMAEALGFPWSLARLLRGLPFAWRERLYDFVARNRLRIYGRLDACYRPERAYEDRFLA